MVFALSCLAFIKPGYYNIHLDKNRDYTINLENYTAFTFRNSIPHQNFSASRGYGHQFAAYNLPPEVHHFSASESHLILSSKISQNLSQWIIPSKLCSSRSYFHSFPFLMEYQIDTTKFTTSCFFFDLYSAKHHITIYSPSRDNTFTAQLYSQSSLAQNTHSQICLNSTACALSEAEPFFIRLSTTSNTPTNFTVSISSLRLPFAFNKRCQIERIVELEEAKTGKRENWDRAKIENCKSAYEDLSLITEASIEVVMLTLAIFTVMAVLGCINCRSFCCCKRQDANFDSLRGNTIARVVKNPIDVLTGAVPGDDDSLEI